MNHEKLQAKIEAATKEMQANRRDLIDTARNIHGKDYADILENTASILIALKAASTEGASGMGKGKEDVWVDLFRQAAQAVLTVSLYKLCTARNIDRITPEAEALTNAFQKDVVAVTNHGYKRINIKLSDLEDDA